MDQLEAKIKAALYDAEIDAVLVFGPDNFNYLTSAVLPFAEHYPNRGVAGLLPKEGAPLVVCPQDWSKAITDQGWKGEAISYDENSTLGTEALVNCLAEALASRGLDKKKIGFDSSRTIKATHNRLHKRAPHVEWVHADEMIRELRIIKTSEEVSRIKKACKQTDMGIIWALMHLEGAVETPGYHVAEFTERMRVHINENGASGIGHLNTAFGLEGKIYYTPQRGLVRPGQLIRMDVTAHYMGYWANLGRMGVVGKASPMQEAAYIKNTSLKEAALENIRPGVPCNEVYTHVVKAAEKQNTRFWKEAGIGHGVGASHYEAPYLTPTCDAVLRPGMTLALDVYTFGPDQELIHSKDIYLVTEEGSRKLSWYRSWDRLYEVTGWRATH